MEYTISSVALSWPIGTGLVSGDTLIDCTASASPRPTMIAKAPEFAVKAPASFGEGGGPDAFSEPFAVLSGPRHAPELRIDLPENMKPLTPRAAAALEIIFRLQQRPGFFDDIYKQDDLLDAALKKGYPYAP